MKNVEKFNSPLFGELRCIQNEEGAPLFCLADVCKSLELRVNDVIKRTGCAPDIIGVSKEIISHGKGTGAFKEEDMYFVTEPDLYRCIFQSRKPTARKFQDWVFYEVLPSLRTKGGTDESMWAQKKYSDKYLEYRKRLLNFAVFKNNRGMMPHLLFRGAFVVSSYQRV